MPVEYPAMLPPPSGYGFSARERRAMSSGDGPQQARTRARDPIVDAERVSWRYSPAEMEAWQIWYRDELLWGQLWFAVPLPGYGGELVRVARYVSAVDRQHVAAGVFEVSADLEIRGRSALPTAGGGAAAVIGWHSPVNVSAQSAAHANSGSGQLQNFSGTGLDRNFFAGVVGATEEDTVVWSLIWTPLTDLTTDPAPVLSDLSSGRVIVEWQQRAGGGPFSNAQGSLILTATVNGTPVAVGQRLVAVVTDPFYSAVSWGPEP